MKFKITPEDLKHLNWFEPQIACEQITEICKKKIADYFNFCSHPDEYIQMKLVGEITDQKSIDELGIKEIWRYVCTSCDKILEPASYK